MTDTSAPVSVIIPCYLCHNTIERAVLSVVHQTVLPSEILLIDDSSPDDGRTVREIERLVKKYADTVPAKLVRSQRNLGPGGARNLGWRIAGQPFIAFLDADDAWSPRKIEIQYAWMRDNPEYKLTCHRDLNYAELGITNREASTYTGSVGYTRIRAWALLYSNYFATRTVMVSRNLPFRFREGKRYAEDYLLWLEIVLSGVHAARLEASLAFAFKRDFGSSGLSANLLKMEQGELECFRHLYERGLIGICAMTSASFFSVIKFLRRIVITILK
jgi:glycosyltransferase involved in cell wall biosynthesis